MSTTPVWLIIGCSSGFGQEMALQALERGYKVIVTARKTAKLSQLEAKGAHAIALDVTHSDADISKAIDGAVNTFGGGRLDVLVNNAGYLLVGAVDECSHEEYLDQFNTNVFGLVKVARAVLPIMRRQKSGVIANMGSIGGFTVSKIGAVYCATKFAVVALSEGMKQENEQFGIEVVCIEPGYFRTDFLAGGHQVKAKKEIPELAETSTGMKNMFDSVHHKQPGDPVKGSKVILDALSKTGGWEGEKLPVRMFLGSDAYTMAEGALRRMTEELEMHRDQRTGTDCDDVK